jgi:hypothetical protein
MPYYPPAKTDRLTSVTTSAGKELIYTHDGNTGFIGHTSGYMQFAPPVTAPTTTSNGNTIEFYAGNGGTVSGTGGQISMNSGSAYGSGTGGGFFSGRFQHERGRRRAHW